MVSVVDRVKRSQLRLSVRVVEMLFFDTWPTQRKAAASKQAEVKKRESN